MKYLAIGLLVIFSLTINAKEINYIYSDKLKISGPDPERPGSFRSIHYDKMMGIEPVNNIIIEFNLDNVKAIIIHDMNAKNNKCGNNQKKEIYYLVFLEPEKNVKGIRTMINGPCLVNGRDALLRLRVSTADGKYYENMIKLRSAHHYIDSEN